MNNEECEIKILHSKFQIPHSKFHISNLKKNELRF